MIYTQPSPESGGENTTLPEMLLRMNETLAAVKSASRTHVLAASEARVAFMELFRLREPFMVKLAYPEDLKDGRVYAFTIDETGAQIQNPPDFEATEFNEFNDYKAEFRNGNKVLRILGGVEYTLCPLEQGEGERVDPALAQQLGKTSVSPVAIFADKPLRRYGEVEPSEIVSS